MRDFSSSFFISTTEKEVKTSQKQQRFFRERERQRDRETKREEKTSLVVVSRVIIIIIIREREREREREIRTLSPMFGVLLWGQETKFCVVFSMTKRTRKGKKKRRALAKAPLSRSAVDDDIFGKIDGCYINTGCASSLFLCDSRVLFLSFSLSKGKERNYYAGVTM
jgi:hypothetical protein